LLVFLDKHIYKAKMHIQSYQIAAHFKARHTSPKVTGLCAFYALLLLLIVRIYFIC